MSRLLDDAERSDALKELGQWRYDGASRTITRSFELPDFSAAFGLMSRVALAAQAADHHPDWSNSYAKVTIALTTHDVGGLSDKDIALAKAIDAIAAQSPLKD